MAATYQLKILTPHESVFDGTVSSMVAPGDGGYLGVLANHAPLITTLMKGNLRITLEGGEDKWYSVDGGILRVAKNAAVLLSEGVEEAAPSEG